MRTAASAAAAATTSIRTNIHIYSIYGQNFPLSLFACACATRNYCHPVPFASNGPIQQQQSALFVSRTDECKHSHTSLMHTTHTHATYISVYIVHKTHSSSLNVCVPAHTMARIYGIYDIINCAVDSWQNHIRLYSIHYTMYTMHVNMYLYVHGELCASFKRAAQHTTFTSLCERALAQFGLAQENGSFFSSLFCVCMLGCSSFVGVIVSDCIGF